MTVGRPSDYKKEYIKKVDEYLALCQDEEVEIVKQRNEEKGYEMYENKLKVKLPTVEGFSLFVGISKKTLYDWARQHTEFLNAFERIVKEQHDRLVNSGLSGDYNSTIAKLMLSSNHGYKERNDTTSDDKPIIDEVRKEKSDKALDAFYEGNKKDTTGK